MSDKPYTECTPEEWAAIESLAKTEAEAVRLFDTRSEPRQERLGI